MIMHSMKSIYLTLLSLVIFTSATFAVPAVLNYAGQVAVNGEAFSGNGSFKFAIVSDSGTTTYWSNDGTSLAGSQPTASVNVPVNGGLYSVLLGNSAIQGMNAIDPSAFQQHGDAKLRVWFSDGVNGFQQLTPDRPFASVPYALSAASAVIAPGSINGSMLSPSLLSDLNGSISTAKMDPNLVRYFIPEISANPAAVSIIQGTDTTLSVQASGKYLSYQWQKNGADLVGETDASLDLSNATASADDANYSVVISNDWGSITSPLARVTVATALPAITILGSVSLVHEAATPYTDAGATAVDALGGDLSSAISITSADINVSDVGNQVVTYSVSDAGGNTNTASRTVTVEDTTDPVITLNQGASYTHYQNMAWVDPGWDAQDTLDGNLTSSVSVSGTVDVTTTGAYTLNYAVADTAGNQASVTRTVNVVVGSWDKTFGGTSSDQARSVVSTSDGGYLLVGNSQSGATGDKSQGNQGSNDYWAVKIDGNGNKVWDKTYGGTSDDVAQSVVSTSDWGYLLVGYSSSGAGGDKSQNSQGSNDYWAVKIDGNGNKVWDKTFGGTSSDVAQSVVTTTDGGYLLVGYSYSGATGDKSHNSQGGNDYWAVKIDGNGNKVWDKTFGGTSFEEANSVVSSGDGGYLLVGYSQSVAGGDKSQNSQGAYDYWAVKIDGNGNKVWDKTFGGTSNDYARSVVSTSDGGYLLVGNSGSGATGDKSQNYKGGTDYWVVKIDGNGNKVWDNTLGGTGGDYAQSVVSTSDGGYLLVGYSKSVASWDKSQANHSNNEDYWVLKIDGNGNKVWDKTFGATMREYARSAVSTSDGGYLLVGDSGSGAGGDKTQGNQGSNDYWAVKIDANGNK